MKLHLGCFDQPLDGWHNTDITPHITISRIPLAANLLTVMGKMEPECLQKHREGVFRRVHRLNVSKRFPYANDSVECAFSSHMIEHLRPGVARHMMEELQRVIKPGGICRIVAPSLEWALSLYSEETPDECLHGIFQEDEDNIKNRHQWMYTNSSLCRLLSDAGFKNVQACQYRQGNLPDLERIDNRPANSIYVEGMK